MFFNPRFLVSLGVAGIAATALFKVCSQGLAQRERRQLKTAVNRWENEGGNLPSPAPAPTPEKK